MTSCPYTFDIVFHCVQVSMFVVYVPMWIEHYSKRTFFVRYAKY